MVCVGAEFLEVEARRELLTLLDSRMARLAGKPAKPAPEKPPTNG